MSPVRTAAQNETWILGADFFLQEPSPSIFRGNMRIIDGRIVELTRKQPEKKRSSRSSSSWLNGKGLTVFPGFIQAHVHLCQTAFRNQADELELLDWLSEKIWPMEAAHTPQTLYQSAMTGIRELLSTGTTCILDMGTVRHTDSIIKAVKKSGIRANVGKCLMDHPEMTPPSLRESTNAALKEAIALFDRWNGNENDRIRISFAPRFAVSCTEELLKSVVKIAHEKNAVIHTHASENKKEIELVRKLTGKENIAYLDSLGLLGKKTVLAHCVWPSEKEKFLLHKTQTHVTHCPSSNLKLASGIAPIPELKKLGINIALGADGAPCNNGLSQLTEMRLAALIHKPRCGPRSMPALEVLEMATLSGARALQWEKDIGSLAVGKKADLAAFNLKQFDNECRDLKNPDAVASSLVYSTAPHHLQFTMVDGKIVYQRP